ncbi:hypothetical protein GFL49_28795 [Rhizobium leguminosarum bv. viciae]|nr:hypothetical protein [Rhizobium leguminosarum bv. viciae]NKL37686.1 hypothetical protein [Rhizobium leguminosarum bv. viciae]
MLAAFPSDATARTFRGPPRPPHELLACSQQRRFLDARGEDVLHLGFGVPESDEADKTGARG